jgi:imidazolonepropionase-like amidohydrolase
MPRLRDIRRSGVGASFPAQDMLTAQGRGEQAEDGVQCWTQSSSSGSALSRLASRTESVPTPALACRIGLVSPNEISRQLPLVSPLSTHCWVRELHRLSWRHSARLGYPEPGSTEVMTLSTCRKGSRMPHRFPALTAAPTPNEGRLWLTGARVFDGTGGPVRDGAAVLVENGVIRRVGSASEPCPEGAGQLDLQQRTLMPGLIEAHTHILTDTHTPAVLRGAEAILPGTPAHFLQAELRQFLRMGVTTVRFTGAQGEWLQEARQAMRYGAFRGPRLLTCGKIISATAPGGRFYGTMYREADGPDDMRRAVREQIRAGADFIKIMTTGARSNEMEDPEPLQVTEAELAAVADEAHRMGFRLSAHAEGLAGCEAAITHGADTIEHGIFLNRRPDLLDKMAASGQVLVPTLSGYYWMAGLGDAVDPAAAQRVPEMPPELVALADLNLEQGAASMRAARDAGVKIALGSDMEVSVALEIQRMIFHGLTPAETLMATTRTAAQALGLGEHVGTVTEGKLADLLIVEGDPLAEPELLADPQRIWLVLQLGVPAAGRALEQDVGAA